jgi:ABC-type multidrug transport system ATPase subunit
MKNAIEVKNVSKKFGSQVGLANICLELLPGEFIGILGADGSGKTSLMKILATLLLPDSGTVTIFGRDALKFYKAVRPEIGYMPAQFSLYEDLTVEENLKLHACLYGNTIHQHYHLISDVYGSIEPFKKRRAGDLSGGMKQKLAISCALVHNPRLLILDEPTRGIDPISRQELWSLFSRLKHEGITIILSTSYVNEARRCDRIAIMDRGHFRSVNTPNALVADYSSPLFKIKCNGDKFLLLDALLSFRDVNNAYLFGDSVHYIDKSPLPRAADIKDFLEAQGHSGVTIHRIEPDLEDCFLSLINADVWPEKMQFTPTA